MDLTIELSKLIVQTVGLTRLYVSTYWSTNNKSLCAKRYKNKATKTFDILCWYIIPGGTPWGCDAFQQLVHFELNEWNIDHRTSVVCVFHCDSQSSPQSDNISLVSSTTMNHKILIRDEQKEPLSNYSPILKT